MPCLVLGGLQSGVALPTRLRRLPPQARLLLAPPSQGLEGLQSGAELLARLHGSLLRRRSRVEEVVVGS